MKQLQNLDLSLLTCSPKPLLCGNLHGLANGANSCPGLYKPMFITDSEAGIKTGGLAARNVYRLKLEVQDEMDLNILVPECNSCYCDLLNIFHGKEANTFIYTWSLERHKNIFLKGCAQKYSHFKLRLTKLLILHS